MKRASHSHRITRHFDEPTTLIQFTSRIIATPVDNGYIHHVLTYSLCTDLKALFLTTLIVTAKKIVIDHSSAA